jgi:hypothetical protein
MYRLRSADRRREESSSWVSGMTAILPAQTAAAAHRVAASLFGERSG